MVNYAPVEKITWADLWEVRGFRLNVIGGLLLMLLAAPVTYWAFDNQHPYTYLAEQSFIMPPVVRGGDEVLVMWKVVFHRSCPGSNQRMLFDPATKVILAAYDPSPAATTVSLRDGYLNRAFSLPRQLQTGWIGYRAVVSYHCNPLQWVWPLVVTSPDLFFKVEE